MNATPGLLELVARFAKNTSDRRRTGRERGTAKERVADPLAAPLWMFLLQHHDRPLGNLRETAPPRTTARLVDKPRGAAVLEPTLPRVERVARDADERRKVARRKTTPAPSIEQQETLLGREDDAFLRLRKTATAPAAGGKPRKRERERRVFRAFGGFGALRSLRLRGELWVELGPTQILPRSRNSARLLCVPGLASSEALTLPRRGIPGLAFRPALACSLFPLSLVLNRLGHLRSFLAARPPLRSGESLYFGGSILRQRSRAGGQALNVSALPSGPHPGAATSAGNCVLPYADATPFSSLP